MREVEAVTVGTFTVDIIAFNLPKIAEPGEVVCVERPIDLYVGGHASNVAIDLVKLGAISNIAAVGAVGEDVFAHIIERELEKYGIRMYAQIVKDAGTARNVILVVKGEDRRFHIYRGANLCLTHTHVLRAIDELKPKYAYISLGDARIFNKNIEVVFERIKELNTLVLTDIARMSELALEALQKVLSKADIVHLNIYEFQALTKCKNIIESFKVLRGNLPILLTVTKGGEGVIALYKGEKIIIQPPFKIEAKDPTGAGDAFCAGLLTALKLLRKPIESLSENEVVNILKYAQAAGALAVSAPGATTAVNIESLKGLIKCQGGMIEANTRTLKLT